MMVVVMKMCRLHRCCLVGTRVLLSGVHPCCASRRGNESIHKNGLEKVGSVFRGPAVTEVPLTRNLLLCFGCAAAAVAVAAAAAAVAAASLLLSARACCVCVVVCGRVLLLMLKRSLRV